MIGGHRRRYSVLGRPQVRDDRGERPTEYTHKFNIWGEAPREGSSTLRQDFGTLQSEDTLRLRTRYRTDIEIGDRLKDHGTRAEYDIRSVLDVDGRRRYLQLVAAIRPGGV